MKVFNHSWYPKERNSLDIDVEEFLTQDQASGIYLGNPESREKELCAVGYGKSLGPYESTKGIQKGREVWLIDPKEKLLIHETGRNILYDRDKIIEKVVFEGSVEQIIEEFVNKGYQTNI